MKRFSVGSGSFLATVGATIVYLLASDIFIKLTYTLKFTEAFQLPSATARSSGYNDGDVSAFEKILEQKLTPLQDEVKRIESLLDGASDDSKSGPILEPKEPRFSQSSAPREPNGYESEYSSGNSFFPQLQQAGVRKETLDTMSMLPAMFQNQATVRQILPQGIPSLGPQRVTELINSAFSQSPEIDQNKLAQLLETWKYQMANYPSFTSVPSTFQYPQPVTLGIPNTAGMFDPSVQQQLPIQTAVQMPSPADYLSGLPTPVVPVAHQIRKINEDSGQAQLSWGGGIPQQPMPLQFPSISGPGIGVNGVPSLTYHAAVQPVNGLAGAL